MNPNIWHNNMKIYQQWRMYLYTFRSTQTVYGSVNTLYGTLLVYPWIFTFAEGPKRVSQWNSSLTLTPSSPQHAEQLQPFLLAILLRFAHSP